MLFIFYNENKSKRCVGYWKGAVLDWNDFTYLSTSTAPTLANIGLSFNFLSHYLQKFKNVNRLIDRFTNLSQNNNMPTWRYTFVWKNNFYILLNKYITIKRNRMTYFGWVYRVYRIQTNEIGLNFKKCVYMRTEHRTSHIALLCLQ